MARFSDDDFAELRKEREQDASRPLGAARRTDGEQRNADLETWLAAGDNLAEKAIEALDTGDAERALQLARRIAALPVLDGETRTGPTAVDLLLYNEVVAPSFDEGEARGLLDLPLRLLPDLDAAAADELRHVLASMTDFDLPAGVLRRITEVVPPERRLDPPFDGVGEEDLPAAIVSVLRLVLRLRSDED
ncbi:hypothetical protein [Amnibacterium setariae]|uniref:Uncharacterized protein n=1 Tax=Amnibacterium setariae TaxID=2306585 RepID=A0A3A1TWD4_9MICO|nr:hypothetical protein [Amnibacterium setariae]RIX27861.1 hypothetical protein D1781_10025 [Amnibacterium setariae]